MDGMKRKVLSDESKNKIIESADILKRQKRAVDIARTLDLMKLPELEEINLEDQVTKLPDDSEEKKIMESSLEDLIEGQGLQVSKAGIGGVLGAGLGSAFAYLIADAAKDENKVAWAGLGAAIGGAIGGLIGSIWDN